MRRKLLLIRMLEAWIGRWQEVVSTRPNGVVSELAVSSPDAVMSRRDVPPPDAANSRTAKPRVSHATPARLHSRPRNGNDRPPDPRLGPRNNQET